LSEVAVCQFRLEVFNGLFAQAIVLANHVSGKPVVQHVPGCTESARLCKAAANKNRVLILNIKTLHIWLIMVQAGATKSEVTTRNKTKIQS
jgi:hypothetical protein